MHTNSLIVYIKTEVIYTEITKDIEAIFNASNFEIDRPLLKGKIKK